MRLAGTLVAAQQREALSVKGGNIAWLGARSHDTDPVAPQRRTTPLFSGLFQEIRREKIPDMLIRLDSRTGGVRA